MIPCVCLLPLQNERLISCAMTCGSPTLSPVVKLEKGVRGLPLPYFPKFDFVLIYIKKKGKIH